MEGSASIDRESIAPDDITEVIVDMSSEVITILAMGPCTLDR